MANVLPPPPVNDKPGSFAWLEWYRQLRNYVSQSGSVPWSVINFAGSNIQDIQQRSHQVLQNLQGGTTGQYYHLSQSEHDAISNNTLLATEVSEYLAPSTGFSKTISNGTNVLILNPSGTLASGTVVMPPSPIANQIVRISSSQTITALTHNANSGQAIKGALTTISSNGFGSWIYRSTDSTWYRIG